MSQGQRCGRGWAVATPHSLASEAAAATFQGGGNAVDAALTAAAMLTVAYPHQCSVGGDLIALVGLPDGSAYSVNGSGAAPQALARIVLAQRFRQMPVDGPHTVTVPGVLAGWSTMADRWGSRPIGDALDGASQLAREGCPVAPGLARDLAKQAERLAADPGMSDVYFREGRPLRVGDVLHQPALAKTLARVRDDGVGAFYEGVIGRSVVAFLRRQGAVIAEDDLRTHRSLISEPWVARFGGEEYLSAPPNSQGVAFLASLRVLAHLKEDVDRPLDLLEGDAGMVARVLSVTGDERDRVLGDADVSTRQARAMLSEPWVEQVVHQVLGEGPVASTGTSCQSTQVSRSGDTVAVVTADATGRWVCLIQSMFHAFGAALLDPESGVALHNRGAAFSLDRTSASVLAPGRRPPHSLMPVLVRRDGVFVGAHGTMGGRAQPQIHLQVALRLAAGMRAIDAVSAPRWALGPTGAGDYADASKRTVAVEQDVSGAALTSLHQAGFTSAPTPTLSDSVGHFQIVRALPWFEAASDPRADGRAIVR